jgi:hypothetical protein
MVGVALGRLWDTHPRIAFVLHLGITVMLGSFALSFILSGTDWGVAVILSIGFLVMAAILVLLTWLAIKDHWQADDNQYHGESPGLPSPLAAWGSAQVQERVLWVLFAVAFLFGGALLSAKSGFGVALVVLSLPLAVVAMRAGR